MRTPYWARPISVHRTRGARYGARRVLSFAPLSIVVVPVVVLSRVSVRVFERMLLPVVIAPFLVGSAVAVLARILLALGCGHVDFRSWKGRGCTRLTYDGTTLV